MSEFQDKPPLTYNEHLRMRLNSHEVRALLDIHLKDLMTSGILSIYNEILRTNLHSVMDALESAPATIQRLILDAEEPGKYDDIPNNSLQRLFNDYKLERYVDLSVAETSETPILVLKQTYESPGYSYVQYCLEKVDPTTGEVVDDSVVTVFEDRLDDKPGLLSEEEQLAAGLLIFSNSSPEAKILRRHFKEQVAAGINYSFHHTEVD